MSPTQEQLIALGAVFEAAFLVDKIAKSGQISEAPLGCMLGSLLVRDPQNTLEVYGGDDLNLRDGPTGADTGVGQSATPPSMLVCHLSFLLRQ